MIGIRSQGLARAVRRKDRVGREWGLKVRRMVVRRSIKTRDINI